METKYLYIQTFGCQMNAHDSEQMVYLMKDLGYDTTADPGNADLIVINTCSIREKAAQKVYSQLGRFAALKETKPNLAIAVGGCLAQQWGARFFKRAPCIDIVFGTHHIHKLPDLVKRIGRGETQLVETAFQDTVESLRMVVMPVKGKISAFVTIMHGCNNFCSYCVVPHLRGREESRPIGDIINEVRALADHGVREVTLLGQNVNSYGQTIESGPDFPMLLRSLGLIRGIDRIRFTTSHPKDLSDDLIRCFGEIEPLCEHIHLPVQSGSDPVLQRMNRGYNIAGYCDKVEKLRSIRPGISITSDVIVGFPGETDKDFHSTMGLMEKIRFDNLFSFKYSEREGTAAVHYEEQVPEQVKRERLAILQELQQMHTLEKNKLLEERQQDILVEGASRNGDGDLTGRTRSNKIVNFRGHQGLVGQIVPVLVKRAFLHSLRGEMKPPVFAETSKGISDARSQEACRC